MRQKSAWSVDHLTVVAGQLGQSGPARYQCDVVSGLCLNRADLSLSVEIAGSHA